MKDVEILIGQVWSPDVRPLVQEAWRCYNAGAVRACIASTWTAVTADIVTKLVWMADNGDTEAQKFRTELQNAQRDGLKKAGVRAMQDIESTLLDKAETFELIDAIDSRELDRIREDRNLCVHTSLRTSGEVYEPSHEAARAHLVIALTGLLTHPPTQGAKAIQEFCAYICDPLFVLTPAHIQAAFFTRLRTKTRSAIVDFTAKHALLELDPDGRLPAVEHADRMAEALLAFAQRDRALVKEAVAKHIERFNRLDGAPKLRALARLGEQDFFLENLEQEQADHLQDLISAAITAAEDADLPPEAQAVLALLHSPMVRERLPMLATQFAGLSESNRLSVVARRRDPYFVDVVVDLLQQVWQFWQGELAGHLLVEHAQWLTLEKLDTALEFWSANDDCRDAFKMPDTAVRLFETTEHLGQYRVPVFGAFLSRVQALNRPGYGRPYTSLEQALTSKG